MKFIKGLSVSQIVAGSLAAITSFLLSAKIGVGGSVIGAAASYIISTVASNVYKNVLDASGEKLQSITPGGTSDGKDGEKTSRESDGADDATTVAKADESDATTIVGKTADGDAASVDADPEATVLMTGVAGATANAAARTPRSVSSAFPTADKRGLPATNTSTYTVEEIRRKRGGRIDPKRMAIIVSVVSGLIGVAFAAGLVLLFTNGNGTDDVVRKVVQPTTTTQTTTQNNDTDDSSDDTTPSAPTKPDDAHLHDGTGTDSEGTDSSESNGSTDGSDSSDASTNGSTGSGSGSTESNGSTGSGSTGSGSTDASTGGSTGSTGSGSTGSGESGSTGSGSTGSGESGSTGSGSTGSSGTSGSTGGSTGSTGSGTTN